MALILKLRSTYPNVAAYIMNIYNEISFKRIKLYVGYSINLKPIPVLDTDGQWMDFIFTLYTTTYRVGLCLCAYQMSKILENDQITTEEFMLLDHFNPCLI